MLVRVKALMSENIPNTYNKCTWSTEKFLQASEVEKWVKISATSTKIADINFFATCQGFQTGRPEAEKRLRWYQCGAFFEASWSRSFPEGWKIQKRAKIGTELWNLFFWGWFGYVYLFLVFMSVRVCLCLSACACLSPFVSVLQGAHPDVAKWLYWVGKTQMAMHQASN